MGALVQPNFGAIPLPEPKNSLLFSPLTINNVLLENRVCIPAMVTWLSPDGIVTDDLRAPPTK